MSAVRDGPNRSSRSPPPPSLSSVRDLVTPSVVRRTVFINGRQCVGSEPAGPAARPISAAGQPDSPGAGRQPRWPNQFCPAVIRRGAETERRGATACLGVRRYDTLGGAAAESAESVSCTWAAGISGAESGAAPATRPLGDSATASPAVTYRRTTEDHVSRAGVTWCPRAGPCRARHVPTRESARQVSPTLVQSARERCFRRAAELYRATPALVMWRR